MGSRWAWVGMVGLCALTSGCHERGKDNTPVGQREEAAATPGAPGAVAARAAPGGAPATSPVAQGTATQQPGTVERGTPSTGMQVREPAQAGMATGAPAAANTATAGTPAEETAAAGTTEAPARGGRVMIGYEAVQARDDEAWHMGAARAAQDAATGGSGTAGSSLEDVVIASSSVSGRVTRVGKNAITVRDREGGVYELQLDDRSRGLRQGRKVSLRGLQEGTPVRAQFVLMGGRTVARDVQIRR